jgi:hypothetical protein
MIAVEIESWLAPTRRPWGLPPTNSRAVVAAAAPLFTKLVCVRTH